MNNNTPRLSIIIPNYNCLEYLPACIASIDEQDCDQFEIIVIDDGSTDGSRDFLTALVQQRDDLKLIFEDGVGPGAARNIGVQIAQGDFIAFLDADDVWCRNKLGSQLNFMQRNPSTTLTFTNYQHVSLKAPEGIIPCFDYWPEFKRQVFQAHSPSDYRLVTNPVATLFKENVIGTSTVLCRKDAFISVGGFDTQLPSASDWDLWLKLSKIGNVGFTTLIMMKYLMREGSVSSNLPKRIAAIEIIAKRHLIDAQQAIPNIQRFVKERCLDAQCDYLDAQGDYLPRLFKRLETFVTFPSSARLKSLVRSALAHKC